MYFQAESPTSGNFTALGIYLCTCLFFVVASFLEFAILLTLKNSYRSRKGLEMERIRMELIRKERRLRRTNRIRPATERNFEENFDDEFNSFIYRIDIISLFIFSCMFAVFNIFYWLWFFD